MILDQLTADLRYSLRQLHRSPGFALTAILTLALSIGATITILSIVNSTLLTPLPYPQQHRLVGLAFTHPQEAPNNSVMGTSANFLKQHTQSYSALTTYSDGTSGANLSIGNEGSQIAIQIASQSVDHQYFPTLGVQPLLGRNFTGNEDLPTGPKALILSYALWERLFNRNPAILDRIVHLNGESYSVIGVMPATFSTSAQNAPGHASTVDLWQPLRLAPSDPGYFGDNYNMIGRLRDGVSPLQAQQELHSLTQPFYKEFPAYLRWTAISKTLPELRLWPLQQVVVSEARTSLLTLLAAVIAVLLVACLNLAGLMTARASRRLRELTLRSALGASRSNLLRLLLSESILLALAGGILGIAFARAALPALLATSPIPLPVTGSLSNFSTLAAFALALSCVTTLLVGLLPSLTILHHNNAALQASHAIGASAAETRLGKSLLVAQVAVAVVLLSAASLLLSSFLKLRSVPSGVDAKRLAIAQVTLKGDAYATTSHTSQFVEKVLDKLQHYPGIDRVTAVNGLPLDRGLNISGHPASNPALGQNVELRLITPGYFRTLGIPLLTGRDITLADRAGTPRIALISETAARKLWPGNSPIGQQIMVGGKDAIPATIIGIVSDIHSLSLAEAAQSMVYEPFAQQTDSVTGMINGWFPTTFALRLSADIDTATLQQAIQQSIREVDAEIPLASFKMMQTVIDGSLARPQFFSSLVSSFAGFALLLTVIGLFGLLSYQVTQRTREIGVRIALGADRTNVRMLFLRRGLTLTVIGLALGSAISLALPRLIRSVLNDNIYTGGTGVASTLSSSAVALSAASLAMLLAALFASYLPARRASAIEPTEALRAE